MNKQIVLTDREKDVLQMLWDGLTLKEIAMALDLTHGRIRTIRLALGHKLGVHNSWQLARTALAMGLIRLPMAVGKWTKGKPTKPGWYWWRRGYPGEVDYLPPAAYYVLWTRGKRPRLIVSECGELGDFKDGKWQGPIAPEE